MSAVNLFDGHERDYFIREADALAERARGRYVTPGAGQADTYREKYAEALRLDAGEAGPFPHIEAEAPARGMAPEGLAALIIRRRARWQSVSASIETERVRCKAFIRAADTPRAMRNALALMREKLEALTEKHPPEEA